MKGIYLISNTIDNRVYIGSAIDLHRRLYHHKYYLKKGKHHNIHLQRFYDKYGLKCLIFEVIEEVGDENKLIEREQYFIDLYPNKFNINPIAGNSLGRPCSKETRLKISNSLKKANLKGIPKSEATRQKMKKPKTKEHTLKIKAAQANTRKKVYQYSLEKELINIHQSILDAVRDTGVGRRDISANCNGRQRTAKGFIWSFKQL